MSLRPGELKRTPFKRTMPTEPKHKRARSSLVEEIPAGKKFGKWTVISESSRKDKRIFLCRCECGNHREVFLTHLRRGNSQQCKECAVVKHNMHKTPTYRTYRSMLARCNNPMNTNYPRYGGRGIAVDSSWLTFEAFLRDMGERPNGATLDRINNEKGYSKENCRWADAKTQSNNTSFNRIINYKGKAYTCSQLAEHLGIGYSALYSRIKKGHQLDAPLRNRRKKAK